MKLAQALLLSSPLWPSGCASGPIAKLASDKAVVAQKLPPAPNPHRENPSSDSFVAIKVPKTPAASLLQQATRVWRIPNNCTDYSWLSNNQLAFCQMSFDRSK